MQDDEFCSGCVMMRTRKTEGSDRGHNWRDALPRCSVRHEAVPPRLPQQLMASMASCKTNHSNCGVGNVDPLIEMARTIDQPEMLPPHLCRRQ